MSVFVVEDGTGLTNATSYQSTTDFIDYWASGCGSIGIQDISTYTTQELQSALMVATRYIEMNYTAKGDPVNVNQNLMPPRLNLYNKNGGLYPSNEVPEPFKSALSEYAYIQLTQVSSGGIQPNPPKQGIVKRQKDKLDVLETEIEFVEGTQAFTIQRYPYADSILGHVTSSGLGGLSDKISRGL